MEELVHRKCLDILAKKLVDIWPQGYQDFEMMVCMKYQILSEAVGLVLNESCSTLQACGATHWDPLKQ